MARHMAKDADAVNYSIAGSKFVGWAAVEKALAEEFQTVARLEMPIHELKVWVRGGLRVLLDGAGLRALYRDWGDRGDPGTHARAPAGDGGARAARGGVGPRGLARVGPHGGGDAAGQRRAAPGGHRGCGGGPERGVASPGDGSGLRSVLGFERERDVHVAGGRHSGRLDSRGGRGKGPGTSPATIERAGSSCSCPTTGPWARGTGGTRAWTRARSHPASGEGRTPGSASPRPPDEYAADGCDT